MPELKPLPCPACGDDDVAKAHSAPEFWVFCVKCLITGPVGFSESAAITAWNSLPRALTWGEEPPKVPGWYWFSVCKGHAICIPVGSDGKAKLAKDHLTDAELLGGKWAGPIVPPGE